MFRKEDSHMADDTDVNDCVCVRKKNTVSCFYLSV